MASVEGFKGWPCTFRRSYVTMPLTAQMLVRLRDSMGEPWWKDLPISPELREQVEAICGRSR